MIGGHSSCRIHNGSLLDLGASGETLAPSRTSRTVARARPSARAISRTPRPSASRRRISSYRPTVMLRKPIAPSSSCLGTTVTVWAGKEPVFSSAAGFSSGFDIGGPLPRPPGRASKAAPPVVHNPGNRVVLNSGNQLVLNRGNWVGLNRGNSAAGLYVAEVEGLERGDYGPKLKDVFRLARALGEEPLMFLVDVVAACRADTTDTLQQSRPSDFARLFWT